MSSPRRARIAAVPFAALALAALALAACSDRARMDAGFVLDAEARLVEDAAAHLDAEPGDAAPNADGAASADATTSADAGAPTDDAGAATDAGSAVAPGDLTTIASGAVCGALFRCCDARAVERYFQPYTTSDLLAAFRSRIPPMATLDEPSCRAVLKDMMDVLPFGDWVREAEAGHVGFEPLAVAACVAALETNPCGASVRDALGDTGCFAYGPPLGGTDQRRMFSRTRGAGAACSPIRDGVGTSFYGTCDPTVAFCCYEDPASPGRCAYGFGANDVARSGTCAAAGDVGDPCSPLLPLRLCRTGLECTDAGRCAAPNTAALALGDPCIDATFTLLGECRASWCDLFGTMRCEPLKGDGDACSDPYECLGGDCVDRLCAPLTACSGP